MQVEEWLSRIRLGEDSTLEFKRVVMRNETKVEGPHPDGLADELAAMANAQGGTLILGIDDKTKQVLGIAYASLATVEAWLAEICQTRINPALDIVTEHIELPDDSAQAQPVIIITVPRSLMVHRSPNGYFKRVAHAKREMAPDVLARLFQHRSQSRLIRFDEQAVPRSGIADANPLLVQAFLREGEGDGDANDQLQRLHLLVNDQGTLRLSVAGALLCTNNPTRWLSSAYIQAVAYRGIDNDPDQQLDAKDLDGPLDSQIWDAVHFVRRNMKVPAPLPNSMTLDAMRVMSMPRNEVIANLFARYYPVREAGYGRQHIMDRRGAGVDLLMDESERLSGKKPVYENIADMQLRLSGAGG